jgi:hypothetical protein
VLVGPPERRRWFWGLYGAWLFVTFAYFLPAATWNPVSRFELTRSVVERGKLDIDTFADSTGDRAFLRGHWYSDKAPLPALLAVPAYALLYAWDQHQGQDAVYTASGTEERPALRVTVNHPFARGLYVSSLSTAALGGVALAVSLYEILRRRVTPVIAFASTTATVLGTPLFAYATSLYGHTLAAALLFGAVALLDEPTGEGEGAFRPRTAHGPLRWAGMCLAAAIGCEYLAVIPATVIGLAILFRLPARARPRAVLDLAEGAVVPALVIAAYHTACFGAPWRTGYSFIVHPDFAGQGRGLMGIGLPRLSVLASLLFGTRRGLFYVAPITAVALAGMLYGLQKRSADWLVPIGLLAFGALLVVNAGYYMWWGGAAAGPRHLVPALGFLALGVARALAAPRARYPTLGVAVVSMLGMLLLVGVGIEAPEEGNIMLDYAWRSFRAGELSRLSGASNWAISAGLPPGGSLGPLLAWWIVGGRYLARAAATDER